MAVVVVMVGVMILLLLLPATVVVEAVGATVVVVVGDGDDVVVVALVVVFDMRSIDEGCSIFPITPYSSPAVSDPNPNSAREKLSSWLVSKKLVPIIIIKKVIDE